MEEIIDFIRASWVEWIFAATTGTLAYLYRGISLRLKAEQEKNAAIGQGVQSLLRESIVHNYNKYSDQKYCPIYAKESTRRCYEAYHRLGGNDVATELYRKILAMPEEGKTDDE